MRMFSIGLYLRRVGIHLETRTRLGGCRTWVRRGIWRPTRLPKRQCRVWVILFIFFFFDSRQTGLIRPYRVVSAGDWYGRNRPKLALKLARIAKILTSDSFGCPPTMLDVVWFDLELWNFWRTQWFVDFKELLSGTEPRFKNGGRKV